MPVPERIEEQVRSDSRVADVLQHNWVRWGSASYAAAFLRQFTGAVPFAHLDIAGPAWNAGAAWGQVPTGGTGFGVRTLVETVAGLTGRS
jgi:leucyl aminopeptidase